MENNKKTEIKVGLTVLVGLIAFLWILGWTKNLSLFNKNKILKVEFEKVAGLQIGDPVLINGVKKGHIKNIALSNNGVLVTMELEKNSRLFSDASFSIMMLDLMGGKKIEISAGHSGVPIDFNAIYKGKFLGDISTAVAALNAMQSDITTIVKQLRLALNGLNNLLSNNTIKTELKNTLTNLNNAAVETSEFIDNNNNSLNKLLANSNNLILSIDSLLNKNKQGVTSFVKKGNKFIASSQILIDSLNSFMREVKSEKNNLGKFIYNKNFENQLRQTLNKLNELTTLLIKQLNNSGLNVDIF